MCEREGTVGYGYETIVEIEELIDSYASN